MARNIPGGVVVVFKKGNSQELNGYLSDKVGLILEDRSTNANRRTAERRMAAFFFGNQASGPTVNYQGKRDELGLIADTLTTANGNFRMNCFFRKVADKHVVHQMRIDKASE